MFRLCGAYRSRRKRQGNKHGFHIRALRRRPPRAVNKKKRPVAASTSEWFFSNGFRNAPFALRTAPTPTGSISAPLMTRPPLFLPRSAILALVALTVSHAAPASSATITLPPALASRAERSPLTEFNLPVTRIVWQSTTGVAHADRLLSPGPGQPDLKELQPPTLLTAPSADSPASLLLDFGIELHGYIELFTPLTESKTPPPVRIRFGESASEAMAELGERHAQNDHALRDLRTTLPWLGKARVGPTGFRFVRIDALDPAHPVSLTEVRAVLAIRDIPQPGSFRSSDERLNRIWRTGAYTVHLNMQDYLWDGIKRDRLVWVGDMHPETSTINAVFGFNDVVPRSLDFIRDRTPQHEWMNGISAYSMWWVLIHEQHWLHHGDRAYLAQQHAYLRALLEKLVAAVAPDGREQLDGWRFLDWPTSENEPAIHAGLQALLVLALDAGERLSRALDDSATAHLCAAAAALARPVVPDPNNSKSAAALQVLAGQRDPATAARELLAPGGARDVSPFYGYYVLNALARAGETETALALIRALWGAMLDRGATTFFEHFDLAWLDGSSRIDELPAPGQKDLHGDFGAYSYEGFRHSLAHGWSSGPTAWLSEFVLGVQPLAPGCARVRIAPQLGDLAWAEGTYPTPHGPITLRHERRADGTIHSQIDAPSQIEIVR